MRTSSRPFVLLLLTLGSCAPGPGDAEPASSARAPLSAGIDWRRRVLYLIMTDRFANGDPGNDEAGSPGCHNPADPQRFHGGDFAGIKGHLDYLAELGVSALWVTPAYRQIPRQPGGHCGYHGYWADFTLPDDQQIEPKLGQPADLKNLSAALHGRGMRLVLDMVVNHSGDTARLPSLRPDWFHDPKTCARLGDPTVFCPLDGHPDFVQERPDVRTYLNQVSAGWTERFALDGIRMDTARHVPVDYFRDAWSPAVRAIKPDLFTVGEIFREDGPRSYQPYLDRAFDSVFNFTLRLALLHTFARGASVDEVASAVQDDLRTLGRDRTLMLVNFLDNHDVPRFVNEPGLAVSEPDIRSRYLLALGTLFTLPGIPQLYYGDELGLYGGPDPDNRHDMPAWAFDPMKRRDVHNGQALPGADQIFARVQKLIALRTAQSALSDGDYTELWRQNGGPANVLAFIRRDSGSAILVGVNNGTGPAGPLPLSARTAGLADGTVLDEILGAGGPPTLTVSGGRVPLALPAKTIAIYKPR